MNFTENKQSYHPLFIVLFVLDLLPHEAVQLIPRTTQNEWKNKNFQQTAGFSFCALYMKRFDQVAFAHKYSFTRYTLSVAIDIQKTLLHITQSSLIYKKLLRSKASDIVEHITTLAHKGFNITKACKLFGINDSWYYYHKAKINCSFNVLRKCFRQHPNQLSYAEQQIIKNWIAADKNSGKNLTQLYYEALNNSIIFCSKKTFNCYAKKYGYQKPFKRPKATQQKGYRASHLFEYLHVDTTYIPTLLNGVLKLTMVKDNFSKTILHFAITSNNVNSSFIKQVLEQTFEKHQLFYRSHHINIITDGGAENKGALTQWVDSIKAPSGVHKITAKSALFPFANNMIEGSFHLFKHDFLKRQSITDEKQLTQKVNEFITHCQNRYFGELYGLTPLQILNGAIPDKNRFKEQIQKAAIKRKLENKQFSCTLNQCR